MILAIARPGTLSPPSRRQPLGHPQPHNNQCRNLRLPHHRESPLVNSKVPHTNTDKMSGEDPPERPEYVTSIINGLERYNPEAVGSLESYLQEQCEQKYCDGNANRTLLKLYVSPVPHASPACLLLLL